MNPIFYVVLALKGVSGTLEMVEGLVTNQSVLKILQEVDEAIKLAISILGGVSAKVDKGIADGGIMPADPELGGVDAEAHRPSKAQA